MKRTFISLGTAFLAAFLAWLTIVVFLPTLYIETAFNIVVLSFVGAGVITPLGLWLRGRK